MRNLTGLDICFNRNHGNDEMDQLIALDISFNSIDNNRIKIISGMKNLTKLRCFANDFNLEGIKSLVSMKNITNLGIGPNKIGTAETKALSEMKQLTALDLRCNYITMEGAQYISELHNLPELFINQIPLVVKEPIGLATLNDITAEGAQLISSMDSLTFLSIGQNNISSLGAKFIGNGLRNLRTLDIHNNTIDLEGVQAICKLII
ncbi:predicted protein [Naegleria gruberi]|uniref:Predicted protein n=1 Tax=Naegleria gruberi TaxID=5762 RepID=D2VTN3_NAEGR|nr:uncharacterized protein NAEGRDRAFT_72363 [Naegleria gruberi]EFC39758.1 predicted protein [Naegleria gruberi]|eukprot:XP_002672502.1 predicted protein [Naegleria gruberi strain NEG-M]